MSTNHAKPYSMLKFSDNVDTYETQVSPQDYGRRIACDKNDLTICSLATLSILRVVSASSSLVFLNEAATCWCDELEAAPLEENLWYQNL